MTKTDCVTDKERLLQTQTVCDRHRLSVTDTECLWQTHTACDRHRLFVTYTDWHWKNRISVTETHCMWQKPIVFATIYLILFLNVHSLGFSGKSGVVVNQPTITRNIREHLLWPLLTILLSTIQCSTVQCTVVTLPLYFTSVTRHPRFSSTI